MLTGDAPFINEQFFADRITPEQLDGLLAEGWRHFGTHFFRYSYGFYGLDVRLVIPLRIRLAKFTLTKSQRRTLRLNEALTVRIRPIMIDLDAKRLFELHKRRFKSGVPESVHDFLSDDPSVKPCEAREVAVYDRERLLAVSYFDVGETSFSGIYAMFHPDEAHRRLGIFTMLKEIEHAIESRAEFYYQGYSYQGRSFYDYKRQFRGSEGFDWHGNWTSLECGLQPV